jgi:hypothetical protein
MQVYVAMDVVKDIKSVVFLDNYVTRKNRMTNMFVNMVGGIQCHLHPAARSVKRCAASGMARAL